MFGDKYEMEMYKRSGELNPHRSEFFHQESEFFKQCSEISPSLSELHSLQFTNNSIPQYYGHNKIFLPRCLLVVVASMFVLYSTNVFNKDNWLSFDHGLTSRYEVNYGGNFSDYYTERMLYIVQAGDTLWDIAKEYMGNGLGYHAIAEENHLSNPDLIFPGDRLIIPIIHIVDN